MLKANSQVFDALPFEAFTNVPSHIKCGEAECPPFTDGLLFVGCPHPMLTELWVVSTKIAICMVRVGCHFGTKWNRVTMYVTPCKLSNRKKLIQCSREKGE
ncbi:MAG: hypothetical protein [Cressdnaviricota sp.]|nr:MAG: hypothetical protein [Cressdnaviricota sp.]